MTAACFLFCRRAMGEAIVRRSLCPLSLEGHANGAQLGRLTPRGCDVVSHMVVIPDLAPRRRPENQNQTPDLHALGLARALQ